MSTTPAEGLRIYNLFPLLAGSIDEWQKHLDRIQGMGFNTVFVNPFHAVGESGSLYAVKDYYRLNPVFRGKSRRSTDDLIKRFVKACDERNLMVMMDLVINHTAIDSPMTEHHANWFVRNPDGSVANPYAIDPADTSKKTVWYDLAEIDFRDRPERQEIIDYFVKVVRYYAGLGVRGFRCDAAYKVPNAVWRTLFEAIRKDFDDTVFMAESLGALLEQVEQLRSAGFDCLMNSAKWWDFRSDWLLEQYEKFRSIAPSVSFPETHDTERLATELAQHGLNDPKVVERAYRQTYVFAAAFSTGVMMPMGYEYGFRKKLHVVKTTPDDWETPAFDLTDFIAEVNAMKASVPVLNEEGPQRHVRLDGDRAVCLVRRSDTGGDWAVTLINPDRWNGVTVHLHGLDGDIHGGRELTPGHKGEPIPSGKEVTLAPGEVRVFAR
ncbi:MAG: alpha-amylase [Rhodospirillales bacterium]|nr:MAG: alpha-amylase [Rhodospirillales bacterium]